MRGRGGACMAGGVHSRGDVAGGMHDIGGCVAGGHVWLGGGMHGRRDDHCSGWYASYWNAFLLYMFVIYIQSSS